MPNSAKAHVIIFPTKDIIDHRKKSDILIKYLLNYTNTKLPEIPPSKEIIDAECQNIFESCQKELNELIKEKSLKKFGIDISKDAAITSLGILFPPVSLVPFGEKVINLFRDKKNYSLLFFALDIKQRAYNSYKNLCAQNKERIVCYNN